MAQPTTTHKIRNYDRKASWTVRIIVLIICLPIFTLGSRYRHSCDQTDHCSKIYSSEYVCDSADGKCKHKAIFPFTKELDWVSMTGLGLIVLFSALSNTGGMGGSAFFAPITLWIFGYTVQEAGPITKATVFAGAGVNVLLLLFKVHPQRKNETLIDFGLSAVLFPILLAGTMVGIIMNKVLPPLLTLIIPTLFLWKTTYSIYRRVRDFKPDDESSPILRDSRGEPCENLYVLRQSTRKAQTSLSLSPPKFLDQTDLLATSTPVFPILSFNQSVFVDENMQRNNAVSTFSAPVRPFSLKNILIDSGIIFLSFGVIAGATMLRGGQGFNSVIGLDTCGFKSWAIFTAAQLLCLMFSFLEYRRHIKRLAGSSIVEEHRLRIKRLIWWTYAAGIGSTFIGIGSGMILGPVMIGFEFLPEVAASISSFSTLFTSSSTSIQFVVQGALTLKDSASFMLAAALGSLIGCLLVDYFLQRVNKGALVLKVVLVLAFTSSLAFPISGIFSVFKRGNALVFEYPC